MMLIDEEGKFLSQRTVPKMAHFEPILQDEYFELLYKGEKIQLKSAPGELVDCSVWGNPYKGRLFDETTHQFFSDHLGQKVRLVMVSHDEPFVLQKENAGNGRTVSFVDGYPILIVSKATLTDLNRRLDSPVGMDRFRPNFVVEGCDVLEEDEWASFQIGDEPFTGIKPCSRCSMTTLNPDTLEKGVEPMKTLATYRKFGNRINFGAYVGQDGEGSVSIGDEIKVHKWKQSKA